MGYVFGKYMLGLCVIDHKAICSKTTIYGIKVSSHNSQGVVAFL